MLQWLKDLLFPVRGVLIMTPEHLMGSAIDFRREMLSPNYDEDVSITISTIKYQDGIPKEVTDSLLEECGDNGLLLAEIRSFGTGGTYHVTIEPD